MKIFLMLGFWILDAHFICAHIGSISTPIKHVSTIWMGDDSVSKVVGISTMKVKMYDGAVKTLTIVRPVLRLRRGLIS